MNDSGDATSPGTATNAQILAAVLRLERRLEEAGVLGSAERVQRALADPEVRRLILSGRRVAAILRIRAQTGIGLTEAKLLIDQIAQQLTRAGNTLPREPFSWRPLLVLGALVIVIAGAVAASYLLSGNTHF